MWPSLETTVPGYRPNNCVYNSNIGKRLEKLTGYFIAKHTANIPYALPSSHSAHALLHMADCPKARATPTVGNVHVLVQSLLRYMHTLRIIRSPTTVVMYFLHEATLNNVLLEIALCKVCVRGHHIHIHVHTKQLTGVLQ